MPSPSGKVILASAGSGKTTWIARRVRDTPSERALIVTYTTNNAVRVEDRIWREAGRLPEWARVRTWYSFLLEDLVRPFQNVTGWESRVAGIHLASGTSAKFKARTDWKYWFDSAGCIYNDKIASFAIRCDEESHGALLRRLARLYDRIYIDEVQDIAGPDLDLVERLLRTGIRVTMVGDPRQGTYSVNLSPRNAKYRGEAIGEKFAEWEARQLCSIEEHSHSYRCRPEICRLAEHLFSQYPAIESRNDVVTDHDGVYLVRSRHVHSYIARHRPALLRWDKRETCLGYEGMNFGASKGLEFQRVLVFPTIPIRKWIASGDTSVVESCRAKLYVAVTRARQSVGFVSDGTAGLGALLKGFWEP